MTSENRQIKESLPWLGYLAVFAATVFIRLLCLADFISSPYFVPFGGDRALYHNLAISIFRNEWFSNVFSFMPLYPALLGLLYKIVGAPNLAAAAICQAVLEGLTGVVIVNLALRRYGRAAAMAAGGGYALLGTAAAYSLVTMPVSLGLFWTAITAALADKWQNNWTNLRGFVAGLLLGCGGQILGYFWLMIIPFAIWIPCSSHRTGAIQKLIIGSLVIFGAIAAILPSLGHNYLIDRRITPVSTHLGLNIYMGNNPYSAGYGSALPSVRTSAEEMTSDSIILASQLAHRPMTAPEANRFWTQQAGRFWRDTPKKGIVLVLRKIHRAISIMDFDDTGLCRILPDEVPTLRLAFVSFGIIWLWACFGFILPPQKKPDNAVFWIMGISILVGMLMTFVTARYRIPLAILLLPAAGGGVVQFVKICGQILNTSVKLRRRGRDAAALPSYESSVIGRARASGPAASLKFPFIGRLIPGLAGIFIAVMPHNLPETKATDDLNRSNYLCQAGRIAEARTYAKRVCTEDPDSPDAWLTLGNVCMLESNQQAALQFYERALGIQSNRVEALFNSGLALEQSGRKHEACGYYQKVVGIDPRHAKAWLGIALLQREFGNWQDAQKAILKAAEIVGRRHPQIVEFYRTQTGQR